MSTQLKSHEYKQKKEEIRKKYKTELNVAKENNATLLEINLIKQNEKKELQTPKMNLNKSDGRNQNKKKNG